MFDRIKKIVFKCSSICNLNCSYCFLDKLTKTHNIAQYDFEDLAGLVRRLPLDDELEIFITGGEPSLAIETIRRGIRVIKKIERSRDVKIKFTVITNGTNMDGVIELMDEGLLDPSGVKFSWDGVHAAAVRCSDRPELYTDDFFNSKLKTLGKSHWHQDVLVRTAVTEETVDDLAQSARFAVENGIGKWEYYFLIHYPTYRAPEFVTRFEEQIDMIGRLFITCRENSHQNWIYASWDSLFYADRVRNATVCSVMRNQGCADFGRTLYVAYDGLLYPCDIFDQYAFGIQLFENGEFAIGDLWSGIHKEKLAAAVEKHRSMAAGNMRECKESHCFHCSADNIQVIMGASLKECDTCALRSAERRVFDRLTASLQFNWLDRERYKKKFSFAETGKRELL